MTTISTKQSCVTLINTFVVSPDRADTLVDLLVRATEETMRHQQGFISANIHKSLDGTKVANYAQWASKEDFDRIFQNEAALAHMREVEQVVERFEPVLYQVAHVEARPADSEGPIS